MREAIISRIGVLVGAAITVANDWLKDRRAIVIEKIKLHDKDKFEAYRRLYTFASKISNSTFPLADQKEASFRFIMKSDFKEVQNSILHYSEDISTIIKEYSNVFFVHDITRSNSGHRRLR